MVDRVGQQFGNYRLLRLLGQGAFAAVYLGEHQYLERPAAIKVLQVQMEPSTHDAFQREASSARLVRRSLKAARRSARGAGQSTFTNHRSELTVACGR